MTEIGRIVLAVLTYKRAGDLTDLLPLLIEQIGTVEHQAGILVVDNDPAASARGVVDQLSSASVRYVCEPAPGIAQARNRALDESGNAHLLIFIDDDERPTERWLSKLLDIYRETGSAGVVGPVIPDYTSAPDSWIKAGRFFVRKRFPTGTRMPAASTANLLLDLRQVENAGHLRFDQRFGLTGGSDTLFTRHLVHHGGTITWCDEAAVLDKVPPQRLTRAWVLQRAFRSGNSWSRTMLEFPDSRLTKLRARLALTGLGLVRVLAGGCRGLVGLMTRSERNHARGSRTVARGLGMVRGAWGFVYDEYGLERSKQER